MNKFINLLILVVVAFAMNAYGATTTTNKVTTPSGNLTLDTASSAGEVEVASDFEVLDAVENSNPCPNKTDAEMLAIVTPKHGACVNNTTLNTWMRYNLASGMWEEIGGGISDWETAHDYVAGDEVIESGKLYRCDIDHTSGTFATDLAAGDWIIIEGAITGKSENGSVVTVEEIQVPNNQLTETDTNKHRIETGNGDLFANPSFEHATARSSWDGTILGITGSTSSDRTNGLQSYCQTFSGQTVDLHQDSALYEATYATMRPQGFGAIDVKTAINSTPIYVCARPAGSYPSDIPNSPLCRLVDTTDIFKTYDIDFVFGGTSNGFGVTSNGVGVTGTVCYDNAKLKVEDRRKEVGAVGSWQSYTPTFTGFGTVSIYEFKWRQVGSNIEIEGRFTGGTTTATEARITLPNNYTSITRSSATQVVGVGTYSASAALSAYVLIESGVGYMTFGLQSSTAAGLTKANGSSVLGTGNQLSIKASIPVNELSSSYTVYNAAADSFSTATHPLTFKATAIVSSDPVGTYNTKYYDASNLVHDCATAPTISPTNADGIKIFTRVPGVASTCGNPAVVWVKIAQPGTELPSLDYRVSKTSGMQGPFSDLDFSVISSAISIGSYTKGYDSSTGILVVNLALTGLATTTANNIQFTDASNATSGYLVINAQKMKDSVDGSFKDFDYTHFYGAGNAAQAITAGTTNVPFIQSEKLGSGSWSGSVYTSEVDGLYLVTGSFTCDSSVTFRPAIYINGTQRNFITDFTTNTQKSGSALVRLSVNDTLAIRYLSAGCNLVNDTNRHWITISRIPGQAP